MTGADPEDYPGLLVAVEGIDAAGAVTQVELLRAWLIQEGYEVFYAPWTASKWVKSTINHGKKERILTPLTLALLQCTDFSDRLERTIRPPLRAGMVVLAAGYVYEPICRDIVRGVDPDYARGLYAFAPRPGLTFYLRAAADPPAQRGPGDRPALKYYEAGMDLGFSREPAESLRLFQARLLEEYGRLADAEGLVTIAAALSVEQQQRRMRKRLQEALALKPLCRRARQGRAGA